ncbi:MAG TPA: exodeoxyribonuclease I [Sutterellaceae bacterium]|nr:exodeoxyribonuclease I [Sutterellaceae bacterium]
MTTFLWHDYETFGLSPSQDRPAQFAAIRTDDNLNIVEKPICLYCKPSMDTMPSPQSINITGILPQYCEQHGLIEAEFARFIHKEMIRQDTISVGYNSMRFDDEVSRFTFWRNFLNPYDREYDNGCSRFDLFPLVVATWALRPQGIHWPLTDEGDRPSFRLEKLSQANGLTHEHAHDALSDVQATIEMARLIREKQPKLWEFALRNRFKNSIAEMIRSGKPLLWVSPMHGIERGYTRLVRALGTLPGRANHVLMWDLSEDPRELLTLSAKEVRDRVFVKDEELPEGKSRLPIFVCKINQSPFIVNHWGVLSEQRAQKFGIDKAAALQNDALLLPHLNQLMGLWAEAFEEDEKSSENTPDVDAGLYSGGFASFNDKKLISAVNRLSPETLAEWVQGGRFAFEDGRYEELLLRFRARNWPQTLTQEEKSRWHALREERLMQGAGGARTLEVFAQEIEEMAESSGDEPDERMENICGALYDWMEIVGNSLDEW